MHHTKQQMDNILLDTISNIDIQRNSPLAPFIEFLNTLEGYKTKLKNLHWSAVNLSIHKQLDKFIDETNEFQDNIAEEAMGIHGQLANDVLIGESFNCNDPIVLLQSLKDRVLRFYNSTTDKPEYIGIRSEIENFIHVINQYLYLFRISLQVTNI